MNKQLGVVKILRGLDLPIGGEPVQTVDRSANVRQVALLGCDYLDLKPTMLVREGDLVKLGQPLFADKRNPVILFTSPGCGRVVAINRGERRRFVSLVIELDGDEELFFEKVERGRLSTLPGDEIQKRLLESGLWTALRTRPFSKIPNPAVRPEAVFVTAIDTNPLAADPAEVIAREKGFFQAGLEALIPLTDGKVYLCHSYGAEIPSLGGITSVAFSGPHPAGLPGTHIHTLHPVDMQRQVWHIGYQDVIAIGALFLTGRIFVERIVALGGAMVSNPRLLLTRLGANLSDLTAMELKEGGGRVISGSVLSGHTAAGESAFLGRYHTQVSVIPEDRQRKFMDWLLPGLHKHSVKRIFASSFLPIQKIPFSTNINGGFRAMVPIGAYEKVMPLDLKITWLLRSILAGDLEMAQQLGCLELDEEDLALCSYVCPGKIDYGQHLRHILKRIEEEGA